MPSTEPAVQLSIIIVNYNVRYFLEQALLSVRKALTELNAEVWVVDNNSKDESVAMVRERFPEVKLIANEDNPGFSIANNQAIRQAKGKYILLLNPDTLVQENTFKVCIDFMEAHPDAGGLGVRMIDGSGTFLPESKRGFPSPFVAFSKTAGLSKLFPKSRILNRYHLGYLDPQQNHEIEILAGAFMLMRKSTLDEVGLLDEQFFMYGEDIDLSYRIQQGGYKNYYLADTEIIHYKGESTKKGSLNYVRVFYQAMIIFAQKHFKGEKARLFVLGLRLAIYLRALLTLISNLMRKALLPLIDAALIYTGLFLLKDFWGVYHFNAPNYFGNEFLYFNAPLYTLIWLITLYFNGVYDKGVHAKRIISGILTGTLIIAAIYGFLDLEYRSSRMLILLGTFWSLLVLNGFRAIGSFLGITEYAWSGEHLKRMLIVGSKSEADRVESLIGHTRIRKKGLGVVAPFKNPDLQTYLGSVDELDELVQIYEANELIFCLKDIPLSQLMYWMDQLGPKMLYKTISEDSNSIIGSSSKNTSGELYTLQEVYQINDPLHKRSKRVFDFLLALLLGLSFPLHFLFQKKPLAFIRNCFWVLLGKKSWVGFFPLSNQEKLPALKPGVLFPAKISIGAIKEDATQARLNYFYARDYHWQKDLKICLHSYRYLGGSVF